MLKPERKNKSGHLDKRKHLQCVGEAMEPASLNFTALSLLEVTAVGCTPLPSLPQSDPPPTLPASSLEALLTLVFPPSPGSHM